MLKNEINLGIIIFARFSSKRLKGKVLMEINKASILEIILKRVKKVSKNIPIIVATSRNKPDDKIIKFCKSKKIKFFRGSHKNVFDRALNCCKKFKLNSFVRICADRPFLDYVLLDKMIKKFLTNKYDIVTNVFPKTFPSGLACEIVKLNSFKKIKKDKMKKNDFEHIFNYFYRNNKYYKIKNYAAKNKNNMKKKLSLDSQKDFLLIKKIFKKKKYNFLLKTNSILEEPNLIK